MDWFSIFRQSFFAPAFLFPIHFQILVMFRTEINPPPSDWKMHFSDKVFSMGSCFSVHMGQKLKTFKFDTLINPFGTIYNPVSLFQLIEFSLTGRKPEKWSYLHHQGVFRNYHFHSDISSLNENEFHRQIENTLEKVKNFLREARVVILTFGSAVGYRLKENNELVANCHKVPAGHFTKTLLKVADIIGSFRQVHEFLKQVNPGVRFIITVSPDRHLKETLELNSASKAVLRVAAEELKNSFDNVSYFASFELMIDDLRDYRFYKEDMLHPTEQAVNYIWSKFSPTFFDEETLQFIADWEKILKSIHHRPFYPGSKEHKLFVEKTIEKVEEFKGRIDVSRELEILRAQID